MTADITHICSNYKSSVAVVTIYHEDQSQCFTVTNESWLLGEFGHSFSYDLKKEVNFHHHVLFQYIKATAFSASQVRVFAMLSLQTITKLDTLGAGVSSNRITLLLSFVKTGHLIQKYKLGDERQRADFKNIPQYC